MHFHSEPRFHVDMQQVEGVTSRAQISALPVNKKNLHSEVSGILYGILFVGGLYRPPWPFLNITH